MVLLTVDVDAHGGSSYVRCHVEVGDPEVLDVDALSHRTPGTQFFSPFNCNPSGSMIFIFDEVHSNINFRHYSPSLTIKTISTLTQ